MILEKFLKNFQAHAVYDEALRTAGFTETYSDFEIFGNCSPILAPGEFYDLRLKELGPEIPSLSNSIVLLEYSCENWIKKTIEDGDTISFVCTNNPYNRPDPKNSIGLVGFSLESHNLYYISGDLFLSDIIGFFSSGMRILSEKELIDLVKLRYYNYLPQDLQVHHESQKVNFKSLSDGMQYEVSIHPRNQAGDQSQELKIRQIEKAPN